MPSNILNVVIKLRRDNDYNYEKIKETYVPENGEVCLVDTSKKGLCTIVGDGVRSYGKILDEDGYANEVVTYVYVGVSGKLYKDSTLLNEVVGNMNKLYIDRLHPRDMYYFNGEEFVMIGGNVPTATAERAGVMKLYDTTGTNTDGSMTQKSVTECLNKKVSASIDTDTETITFSFA